MPHSLYHIREKVRVHTDGSYAGVWYRAQRERGETRDLRILAWRKDTLE